MTSLLTNLTPGALARGVATVLAAAVAGLFVAPAVFGGPSSGGPTLAQEPAVNGPQAFDVSAAKRPTKTKYTTLIATSRGKRLRIYSARGKKAKLLGVLKRRRFGGQTLPLVMTVADHSHDGWLKVRLPVRPNGATAWVKRSAVKTSATNWRVTVQLKRHRILVHHGRVLVASKPIGVGKALSPTPRGTYFITDLVKSTDPFYGPYAFGLSAFSTVYTSFGGGNGQVGIHGTNAPSGIGSDVSHGCIRVNNKTIRELSKMLPLGTPVRITS